MSPPRLQKHPCSIPLQFRGWKRPLAPSNWVNCGCHHPECRNAPTASPPTLSPRSPLAPPNWGNVRATKQIAKTLLQHPPKVERQGPLSAPQLGQCGGHQTDCKNTPTASPPKLRPREPLRSFQLGYSEFHHTDCKNAPTASPPSLRAGTPLSAFQLGCSKCHHADCKNAPAASPLKLSGRNPLAPRNWGNVRVIRQIAKTPLQHPPHF